METSPLVEPAPIYIVGLGLPLAGGDDAASLMWPAPPHSLLALADVIIGGKAQLASVRDHPAEHLVVGADVPALLQRMAVNRKLGKLQVVLCSGDPLFFGLGARLREHFGPDGLHVLPAVSSLQGAAALLRLPWERVRSVSLHGRTSLTPLAQALLTGEPVFILTSLPPAEIARFLTERGRTAYRLHVLENMAVFGQDIRAETLRSFSLEEAFERREAALPGMARVLVLEPEFSLPPQPVTAGPARKDAMPDGPLSAVEAGAFGIPDSRLERESGLFTKWPVRAAGLAALRISPRHVVWDLGAGSGAVALEAAFLAYQGQVVAVEKDLRRVGDIVKNRTRFGAATLEIVCGTMPECLVAASGPGVSTPEDAVTFLEPGPLYHAGAVTLPRPHRVFLGGGLGGAAGAAAAILSRVWEALLPGGRLVLHCILLESLERARAFLRGRNAEVEVLSMQTNHSRSLGGDIYLEGANPVFLTIARKPGGTPL